MIKNYLYFKNAPSEFFSTQCGDAIGGGATAIYIFFCWLLVTRYPQVILRHPRTMAEIF